MPPPPAAGAAIEARGLVRRFGDFAAVDGVDLTVEPGEIYGFLGPNGAGKSTTVRVLCTLITPDGGSATVAGYDVAAHPEQVRLRIGVALQEAALDPKQTGTELLRLQGRLYGLSRHDVGTRLGELGELVDIGAGDDGAPRRRPQERREHPHQGRLARPVGTEEPVDLAGFDHHVHAVEGDGLAEHTADAGGADRGLGRAGDGGADGREDARDAHDPCSGPAGERIAWIAGGPGGQG
jgi:hypothetical protein